MDILFTGNLTFASDAMFRQIGGDCRCVIYSEKENMNFTGKNTIIYKRRDAEELNQVFLTYDFDTVVYFSYTLDGAVKVFDELEKLEQTMYHCRRANVHNFIYLLSNDLDDHTIDMMEDSRYILMHACEKLCKTAAKDYGMSVAVLKLPYLYSKDADGSRLSEWLAQAVERDEVLFRGYENSETDFLCDEDLGVLLGRMLDEPFDSDSQTFFISGENGCTFGDIGRQIRELQPKCDIKYEHKAGCIPCCKKDSAARRIYGWYPKHVLSDDLKELFREKSQQKKKRARKRKQKERYRKRKERLRVAFEIAVLFIAAEALNYWTKDNVLVNFIDFRLVYVVIIGIINGLGGGIAAAVLSCIGYTASKSGQMDWQLLFYNVTNWLPFACYFLLGTMCGYKRDKYEDALIYGREEYELLKEKYSFLSSLYEQVLASKDKFNSQIIGYRDSFGKLYSIMKKLDTTLPEEVFFEAVNVIEQMLENYSVAIYTIERNSHFARLNVHSKNAGAELGRSLNLEKVPKLYECMKENTMFINRDGEEGYPAYAVSITKDRNLTGMILLTKVDYEQMNLEFSNKLQILSALIRDSLLRAAEYFEREKEVCTENGVLNSEKFKEVLNVKQQMKQKQYMDYVLLKIHRGGKSLAETANKVHGMVRSNDILGLSEEEDTLYLLLSQTNMKDASIIMERFKTHGIAYEAVKE